MNNNWNKYIKAKEKDVKEITQKIENSEINIFELEDDLINNLICYYTKQINLKKNQINSIKEKVKKGKIKK